MSSSGFCLHTHLLIWTTRRHYFRFLYCMADDPIIVIKYMHIHSINFQKVAHAHTMDGGPPFPPCYDLGISE